MAFTIKQNDTLPNLAFQLFQPDRVTPLDLAAVSVINLVVRASGGTDATVPLFKKPCAIISPSLGTGVYDWDPGDTAISGSYEYEFEITWANGDIQTIPQDGYYSLLIVDDIG